MFTVMQGYKELITSASFGANLSEQLERIQFTFTIPKVPFHHAGKNRDMFSHNK
jgi:hypothetical protein